MQTINLKPENFLKLEAPGYDLKQTLLTASDEFVLIENETNHTFVAWLSVLKECTPTEINEYRKQLGYIATRTTDQRKVDVPAGDLLELDGKKTFNTVGLPILVKDFTVLNYPLEYLLQMGVYPDKYLNDHATGDLLDIAKASLNLDKVSSAVLLYDNVDCPMTGYQHPSFSEREEEDCLNNSPDLLDFIDPVLYVNVNGKSCPCFDTGTVRAPIDKRFERNITVPESDGKVFTLLTSDGLEEIFLLDTTVMNYENHKAPVIEPIKIQNEQEGTVTDLLNVETDFKMDLTPLPLTEFKVTGDLTVAVNHARGLSKKSTDLVLGMANIYKPIFTVSEKEDQALINIIDVHNKELLDMTSVGEKVGYKLALHRNVSQVDSFVGRHIKDIHLNVVNNALLDMGAEGKVENLDDLNELKTIVASTGKAKHFFNYLSNQLENMNFSIDLGMDDKNILWLDEKVFILDGEIEESQDVGRVNPHLSPDTYKTLSKAFISMGGTGKTIYCTTTCPGKLVVAYRNEVETGAGDSGIVITDIVYI